MVIHLNVLVVYKFKRVLKGGLKGLRAEGGSRRSPPSPPQRSAALTGGLKGGSRKKALKVPSEGHLKGASKGSLRGGLRGDLRGVEQKGSLRRLRRVA